MSWELLDFLRNELMDIGASQEAPWIFDSLAGLDSCAAQEKAESILMRRKRGEPLAYILGNWDFRGHLLNVGPGVLIPRPETEELVSVVIEKMLEVLDHEKRTAPFKILDLGSGSGAIGISIALEVEHPLEVTLVEKSSKAFSYLQKNVDKHLITLQNMKSPHTLSVIQSDWKDFRPTDSYDFIVSNPPYITPSEFLSLDDGVSRFEPLEALVHSEDDMGAYKELIHFCQKNLKQGGYLFAEFGPAQVGRWDDLIPSEYSYKILKDLSGKDRILEVF